MLTREQVLHIAQLAHLPLTDAEVSKFQKQLSEVLTYVEKLNMVDTSLIPTTTHAIQPSAPRFQSAQFSSLSQDQVLSNAPRTQDGYIVTDAVLP